MAQKFMKTQEVAEYLGLTPADVNRLRETHQLHAYRDGADWKFKAEEVEQFARQRREGSDQPSEGPDEGDVLLSEVELGESDPGASGTVIGPPDAAAGPSESDLQLVDSGLKLADNDAPAEGKDDVERGAGQDDIDLSLDDLTLEESQIQLAEGEEKDEAGASSESAGQGEEVTEDDLVLGGSGGGSDITIGGDSGISLVDPADSGLSLEDPLELGGGEDSLELGEDDMVSFEGSSAQAPAELKADDDFLLTPLEEGGEEDSESGSQVIALDGDVATDDAATMIASGPSAGMAMLDEDLSAMGVPGAGAAPGGPAPMGPMAPAGPAMGPEAGLGPQATMFPEPPYTVWNLLSLAGCVIMLMLGGMMAYDLLRNMWSWNQPYALNSALMDLILSIIG